jgi:hypothetical protein
MKQSEGKFREYFRTEATKILTNSTDRLRASLVCLTRHSRYFEQLDEIIFWNTAYIERALLALCDKGEPISSAPVTVEVGTYQFHRANFDR